LHKGAIMEDTSAQVIDLIFGRWRSQILYVGVKLGVFDALADGPKNAVRVASELGVDAGLLYRLMRALGSLELLHEDTTTTFSLTPMGEWLCRDHPHTLYQMDPDTQAINLDSGADGARRVVLRDGTQ
jgi:hypothetical protein